MVAGDTAYIREGTYNEHVITMSSGNAADGYIVFAAYSGENPIIDGTGIAASNGLIINQSYIKLIGLEIQNWETGVWTENASYFEISDCEVHDVTFGIGIAYGSHDFVLNRVVAHDFDLYGFDVSPSGGADCYNGILNDCIAYTGRDPGQNVDGFALGHGAQHDFILNRCVAYNVYDGFDISAGNTTLNRCLAYSCWNGGYKIWQDNVKLFNCVAYNSVVANVELDWDGQPGTVTLQNCTFMDSQTFNVWVENPGDSLQMYNCIVAGGDAIGLAFEQMGVGNYTGDYNIFQNDNPDRAIAVGYTDEFTLAQVASGAWTAYSGQDSHSLVVTSANELFVNPVNYDLHLTATSPAIDSATSVGALSDDYEGNPRPRGAGYDIGAYEFQEGEVSLPIDPYISVSPTSNDFGTIDVGSSSSPRIFTISNAGTAELIISTMSIAGSDSDQFALQTGTCTTFAPALSSGESCTVSIIFSPTSEGLKSASLQITSNDPDTPTQDVSLSGTGGTQVADLPDLTGEWYSIAQTCKNTKKGMKCKVKGTLRITNTGTVNASSSVVRFYLSGNSTQDATDTELKQVYTGTMKTGKTKSKKFSYKFSTGSSASCQSVIAVIDADNTVEEVSETNNQAVYSFDNGECTDTTPPSVILTSPVSNAVGVAVNAVITAMFSEALDPSTINTSTFTVNGVTGTVTYSGTTATFTPSGSLNENTTYTATLTTGVRDNAGNAMAADCVWSFTTGSSTGPPPTTLTNLFFLHHSTGDGLIVEGDMRSVIASYNSSHGTQFEFWDHGYNSDGLRNAQEDFTGTNYNIPGDNTDPDGLYNLWTSTETEYVNARSQILGNHEVIAFKSCFPASDIPDAATLAQYQAWYLGMRDFFDTRTDRLFIVMSTPPLHRLATEATTAANARAFADWLCSDAYLSGHPNVRCFNLFDYLAKQNDGSATANMLRYEYEESHSDSDSHPNMFGNQTVGPVLAECLCNAAQGY